MSEVGANSQQPGCLAGRHAQARARFPAGGEHSQPLPRSCFSCSKCSIWGVPPAGGHQVHLLPAARLLRGGPHHAARPRHRRLLWAGGCWLAAGNPVWPCLARAGRTGLGCSVRPRFASSEPCCPAHGVALDQPSQASACRCYTLALPRPVPARSPALLSLLTPQVVVDQILPNVLVSNCVSKTFDFLTITEQVRAPTPPTHCDEQEPPRLSPLVWGARARRSGSPQRSRAQLCGGDPAPASPPCLTQELYEIVIPLSLQVAVPCTGTEAAWPHAVLPALRGQTFMHALGNKPYMLSGSLRCCARPMPKPACLPPSPLLPRHSARHRLLV